MASQFLFIPIEPDDEFPDGRILRVHENFAMHHRLRPDTPITNDQLESFGLNYWEYKEHVITRNGGTRNEGNK